MWTLVSTTVNWNPGDDLIRDGVMRLTGDSEPVHWVDRGQYVDPRVPEVRHYAYRSRANAPPPDELAANASRLVVAGTPEWGTALTPLYDACVRQGTPIELVGVGMSAGDPQLLRRIRPLVRRATVRDRWAQQELNAAGIPCRLFPDPAFHAAYPECDKDLSVVLGYRAVGGNGRHAPDDDPMYLALADQLDPAVVTVHEPGEYDMARRLFPGREVFYHSDAARYASLYARCRWYVGGRIHGAIPVLATGGRAVVFYRRPKADCLQTAAPHLRTDQRWPLQVLRPEHRRRMRLDLPEADVRCVRREEDRHRRYLEEGETG